MSKLFKRIISVILCISVVISAFIFIDFPGTAAASDGTDIPLIYVQGSGMPLFVKDENGEEILVSIEDDEEFDSEYFRALLMVKDFNAEGFSFSDEFMTTADVPTLATSGVIANPTNPFTGNAINTNAKYDRPFYAFYSSQWDAWDTSKNNGNQFFPGTWYRIDNQNARDKHNWVQAGENAVLPDALR